MGSFRREKSREKKSRLTGSGKIGFIYLLLSHQLLIFYYKNMSLIFQVVMTFTNLAGLHIMPLHSCLTGTSLVPRGILWRM